MTPSDLPEQGDPADGRQCLWTVEYSGHRPAEVIWDAPSAEALISTARHCGYVVRGPYVPLERAQRAERERDELKRLLRAEIDHATFNRLVLDPSSQGWEPNVLVVRASNVEACIEGAERIANRHPGFLPNDPGENG